MCVFVRDRERNREYEVRYEQPTGSLGANKESQISRNSVFLWKGFKNTKHQNLLCLCFHNLLKTFRFKRYSMHVDLASHSVQFSHSVMSNSLQPHGLKHARLPCPSPTPRACSNSCPSSQWWHPTIPSSVIPFSSWLQSFLASQSFPINQFFASGGQRIGVSVSASVLPVNIQEWFLLGLTGLISSQSKGLSRVFSNTTVQN